MKVRPTKSINKKSSTAKKISKALTKRNLHPNRQTKKC